MKMRSYNAIIFTLLVAFSWNTITLTPTRAIAAIIEISIAPNSQANSRPSRDNVYDVIADDNGFADYIGIGIIINPIFLSENDQNDFALHQNGNVFAPTIYSKYTPNPINSSVLYKFDKPTIVKGIQIVQHFNGVTSVGGKIGNSADSLAFLGSSFGSNVMDDGTIEFFNFGNTMISGTVFEMTIDQTLLSYAFAIHRAYLIDENNQIIPGASAIESVPEPKNWLLFLTSMSIYGFLEIIRRRSCMSRM